MAVKAYVLISADPGQTRTVFDALQSVQGIVEKHEVMGPYDIVLQIEAPALNDVPSLLSTYIRTIPGVESTTTLIAFPRVV